MILFCVFFSSPHGFDGFLSHLLYILSIYQHNYVSQLNFRRLDLWGISLVNLESCWIPIHYRKPQVTHQSNQLRVSTTNATTVPQSFLLLDDIKSTSTHTQTIRNSKSFSRVDVRSESKEQCERDSQTRNSCGWSKNITHLI